MRPLRPLLSKKMDCKWEEEHENAFQTITREIQKITEVKDFKKNQPARIVFDVSRVGLGGRSSGEK